MTCPIKRAADETEKPNPGSPEWILEQAVEGFTKELAHAKLMMSGSGCSEFLASTIAASLSNQMAHIVRLLKQDIDNFKAENDGLIKERTDRAAYVARLEKDLLTGDNYRCERCRKVFHYLNMHYVGDDRYCDSCLPQAKAADADAEREERSIEADMRKLHSDNMKG